MTYHSEGLTFLFLKCLCMTFGQAERNSNAVCMLFPDDSFATHTEYMQDGDLSNYLKAQGGQLLPEDAIMLHFVQICLAIQYIHSKVISTLWLIPFQMHIAYMHTNDEDCSGHATTRLSTHASRQTCRDHRLLWDVSRKSHEAKSMLSGLSMVCRA